MPVEVKEKELGSRTQEVMTNNKINEDSRIKLFPIVIEKSKDDSYKVLRLGYKAAIGVRQIGVDTINILKKGSTIRDVKQRLSQQYACSPSTVKIEPLVEMLVKAGLVKSINGRRIKVNKTNPRQYVEDRVRLQLKPKVRDLLSSFLFRYIPLGILRPILFIVNRIMKSYKKMGGAGDCTETDKATSDAVKNLRNAFSAILKEDELNKLIEDYRYYQEMTMIDGMLGTIVAERWIRSSGESSKKIEKWLWKMAGASGSINWERLDLALKENKGVILCGFHFGLVALLPILLSLHGYPLTSAGLVDTPALAEWHNTKLKEKLRNTPGVGDCTMLLLRDLETLMTVESLLKRGEIVVMLAGGMVKAIHNFPADAEAKVTFLGRTVWSNSELTWLHLQTGAPILPVKVIRKGRGALPELVIDPPLQINGQKNIDEITKAIYQALEKDVLQYPAQWHNWSKLHRMWMRVKVN